MVEKLTPNFCQRVRSGLNPQASLSESEQKLYDSVLAHYSDASFEIPEIEEKPQLMIDEQMWLTSDCILRYLRATKWDKDFAIRRLNATLKWRRDYGIQSLVTPEHVEPEALTGKMIISGFDVESRPSLYLLPSRQNTDGPERQIQFTFFMVERTIDLMNAGVESLTLLIDFADKAKNPSLGTARQVLSILQEHYPERLGKAMIINLPWLVNLFFKAIMPFVDPKTRTKIHFNPLVVEEKLYDSSEVTKSWGGEVDFIYEHGTYWPELLKITNERRAESLARWKQLGAKVGISEWDIKGGSNLPPNDTGDKKEEA